MLKNLKFISPAIASILIFFSAPLSIAQENEAPDKTIYVIRNIRFDVTGLSLPFALRHYGKLAEGEELKGKEALDFYIADRTQLLVNQRVLKDDVRISFTLGEADKDGKIPVDLLVKVSDTLNVMVFPKPLYDQNSGVDLTLKGRDYNFLGTMSPLLVDLGWQRNNRKENKFNFLIDTDIPFTALGYKWNINFDNKIEYFQDEPLGYFNTAGIAMELPLDTTTFTFDITHKINWHEENSDRVRDDGYGKFFEGLYNSLNFSVEWKIPTGFEVFSFGELTYTPEISQEFNYNPRNDDEYEWKNRRESNSTSIEQTLGFGRTDWIGNFRKGLEASFKHESSYNHIRDVWNHDYSLNATAHFLFSDFSGLTSRMQFHHWIYEHPYPYYNSGGNVLRGVLDDQIKADLMLSLNLEFPFRVFIARISDWMVSKVPSFNVELFVSPIFDFGLAYLDPPQDNQDSITPYYTGGIEVLLFPDIMRSLYIRVSYGVNLGKSVKENKFPAEDELFIGLRHFF
jgi:hypothetical protein